MQQELEGFGASLAGRCIYVYANGLDVWIPWEFVSDTTYSCKILLTSDTSSHHILEMDPVWTYIARPRTSKDWSCLATILKGMGGSVLLTIDEGCPPLPETFVAFLNAVVQEGRVVLTRIWIGTQNEPSQVPDAVFFPVHLRESSTFAYDMLGRLPARHGHGGLLRPSPAEWLAMVSATSHSGLGIVASDIGENRWSLFWHKVDDSEHTEKNVRFRRGLALLKTAAAICEKATT